MRPSRTSAAAKAESLGRRPLARGTAQGEVWDAVREQAARLRVETPTRANADVFRAHRASLVELEAAFPLQPGQCGAVLAVGDALCLDAVSRPDAFARLYPKLRAGYLLDALERLDARAADDAVERFVAQIDAARVGRGPSAGRGTDLRLTGEAVIGSGLELDGELLQMSAFRGNERRTPIARPSQRRQA